MPNISSTILHFYGEPCSTKRLYDQIIEFSGLGSQNNSTNNNLQNIADKFGVSDKVSSLSNSTISQISAFEDGFFIDITTAGWPATEIWKEVISKHFVSEKGESLISFDWLYEDKGNDIFQTNNLDCFKDYSYRCDFCVDGDELHMYFNDEDSVLSAANEFLLAHGRPEVKEIDKLGYFSSEEDYMSIRQLTVFYR